MPDRLTLAFLFCSCTLIQLPFGWLKSLLTGSPAAVLSQNPFYTLRNPGLIMLFSCLHTLHCHYCTEYKFSLSPCLQDWLILISPLMNLLWSLNKACSPQYLYLCSTLPATCNFPLLSHLWYRNLIQFFKIKFKRHPLHKDFSDLPKTGDIPFLWVPKGHIFLPVS